MDASSEVKIALIRRDRPVLTVDIFINGFSVFALSLSRPVIFSVELPTVGSRSLLKLEIDALKSSDEEALQIFFFRPLVSLQNFI